MSFLQILLILVYTLIFSFPCALNNEYPIENPILDNTYYDLTLRPEQILTSFKDERDGEEYETVQIGDQLWMAENLRFKTENSTLNLDNPSKKYGRLYNVIVAQSACPHGWHLPSDSEWEVLELEHGMPLEFLGKGGWRGEHAQHLKSINGWNKCWLWMTDTTLKNTTAKNAARG